MAYFKSSKQLAAAELARRKKVATYQNDPVSWLTDRFGEGIETLQWDQHPQAKQFYAGHKWDGTPNPFLEMFKALADKRWCGIESATSTGKTFILPRVLFWFLDTFPDSLVVTTAPKKDQLRRILWMEIARAFPKFKKIRPHAEMLTLNLTVDARSKKLDFKVKDDGSYGMDAEPGWEAIGIVSGVGAGEESATKMQGFHKKNMLFLLEETAGIHSAVLTAVMNTCTAGNNLILGVGNPDSEIDALHQLCIKKRTKHIIVSAYDHPNVVSKMEIIPGAVTLESVVTRLDDYGENSPFFKSRVRGIAPTEANDSLIKSDYFDQCWRYGDKWIDIPIKTGYNALGVDVANSEMGDMAALAWGKNNELLELNEFHCSNATHLAYNVLYDDVYLAKKGYTNYNTKKVKDFNIHPQSIGVDSVGIGVATVNAFFDEGWQVISLMGGPLSYAIRTGVTGEDLYDFGALRSQMYFEAREDLRMGSVIIGIADPKVVRKLKAELITIKYSIKGGNKIQVERKDEIKKRIGHSPNLADAFVYWNWIRKGYYIQHPLPFV